ncbi:MarR family transcriptional regulator [Paracoccus sp. S-4012]|uniref:MarR family winged helix-turn-helix transcriptional regulator n=1 Tax=Paracoccus sp. S-4012 TaxID=2665648 RepID=UPI0012B0F8BA|nr:MarR family transcriptional regulator [Paracoccus sp. S-4012]MRX51842.1 MarR family transcriptional regulator [Paracoccus sp. S-4012]
MRAVRLEEREAEAGALAAIGLDGFAPYLMNRLMGRYNAGLRAEMARLGWTTPKMRALAVLSVIDGPLIRELAGYTVTEQSTLSRALDALAAEGLIRREAHEEDSRAVRVYLTAAGRTTFERFWPSMAQAAEDLFHGIPPRERAAFTATLQKMLANLHDKP